MNDRANESDVLHLPYRELPLADPGTPPTSTPGRYLVWLAGHQRWLLSLNALFGIGWMVAQALVFAALGAAIDHGVDRHDTAALLGWVGVVLGLGLVQAICGSLRHQLAVTNWLHASYRSIQVLGRHMATAGPALTEAIPAGDVVNTANSDAIRVGTAYDSLARFLGAIVSWVVVSFILLATSRTLGLVVLVGVPVLGALSVPLMRPLHRHQAAQRESAGRLAALGADTVAGLRILRGVGGEEVFHANYVTQSQRVRAAGVRLATPQAALESGQVLLPAVLTTVVTFLGAHEVMAGRLQPGQLVAFFGYATFLTTPLRTAIEYIINATQAFVAAGKIQRVLRVEATVTDVPAPLDWPEPLREIRDARTGLVLGRGEFAGLVGETTDETAALVDRLGRFVADVEGVSVNGVPLGELALAELRRRVVVSEIEPRLFAGELRHELMPHETPDDERILRALATASALEVLDALDDGLATPLDERGRGLSGGQRQRLALARAVLTGAEVLLLVEPTSAVDAHTEGRVAARLAEARAGATTLVASSSPLVLERCDVVSLLVGGRVVERGRHEELLERSPLYRRIVLREETP
ncbi:MAG TPA: ABC transporter ATP-binding protein [Acidimicrobiales bacterium]|nr:ABC transporter ATP-binding protein [Acidimicrobiales bacterium]